MKKRNIILIVVLVIAVGLSGVLYAVAQDVNSVTTVQTTTSNLPKNATAVSTNWSNKTVSYQKEDGSELKIDFKVSNPLSILGTVVDPRAVIHNMNMTKSGNGTVEMTFDAPASDPTGYYTLHVQLTKNNNTSDVSLSATEINHKVRNTPPAPMLPPLKQLKSGIIEYNVRCADNMYLTLSPVENRMACVKIETAQKLAERGWKSFIPQTPDEAAVVLKQCHDSGPLIDYATQDNKTDSFVTPKKSYSTTFWWAPLDSVAKICMKYHSSYDNIRVPLHIREPNSYNYAKFMVKASQDTISKGTTIVSYEFNTGNQKGQYLMSFDCGEIPIAIGSDASDLNRTDYPLVQKYSCPGWGFDNSTIVGTSGIYEKYFK